MIVAVQGTNDFDDYNIFIRAMGVALSTMQEDDKEFVIYSAGPARINSFVSEFSNLSERGMKARVASGRGQLVTENIQVISESTSVNADNDLLVLSGIKKAK